LKTYLKTPTIDLLVVFQRLTLMLENQFVELKQKAESDKICVAHKHNYPCMRQLLGHVSKFGLTKIAEQVECATRDGCTGTFTRVWGLPCRHRIWHMLHNNALIEVSDVHSQWLLHDNMLPSEMPEVESVPSMSPCSRAVHALKEKFRSCDPGSSLVLEARVHDVLNMDVPSLQNPHAATHKRGRPVGSRNNKANKRDGSGFEWVQARKCKNGGGAGHNVRTCAK